jgi:hypothetical protein
MQDDLGVKSGREAMALAQQLVAQFAIVVDLAVADDRPGVILVGDRLMAAIEIDDRQAALPEDRALADIAALVVGAAMPGGVQGATDRVAAVLTSADQAGNSTHCSESPLRVATISALATGRQPCPRAKCAIIARRRPAHDGWWPSSAMR